MKTIICEYCDKKVKVTESFIEQFGHFCSVGCAQKCYEDEYLQEELQSSNPQLEDLENAVERLI